MPGEAGQPFLVAFVEQLVTGLILWFHFHIPHGDNRQQNAAGRPEIASAVGEGQWLKITDGTVQYAPAAGFHFTFQPAGAAAKFDGSRKGPILDELVKPLIGQAGQLSDKRHIDHLVIHQRNWGS